MSKPYLILNAGSSSLRFALFEPNGAMELSATLRGHIEGIPGEARFVATSNAGRNVVFEHRWTDGSTLNHEAAAGYLLEWVQEKLGGGELAACGHRVVHGGMDYEGPALISAPVLAHLETLVPLAPLHQPHNLALIRIIQTRHPNLPQVACFDTAFHRHQPRLAQLFALPRQISERGVYRYGFHGLSFEHIASVLPTIDPTAAAGRTVVAHLGSGASLCALRGGKSIATTMGMSPLDGLPMGTRCGALDPAVAFYLMRERRRSQFCKWPTSDAGRWSPRMGRADGRGGCRRAPYPRGRQFRDCKSNPTESTNRRRNTMKPLIIISMVALIFAAGLSGTQLRAEDAHHPEKSAKAKKSTAKKLKQPEKKKPAVKTKKSNQSE